MNLKTAPREILLEYIVKLEGQIAVLGQENQTLKQQITELRKQLEGKTPSSPPLFVKPSVPERRKKKRKKRKENFARKRDIPTQIVKHAFSHCPDCGEKLYAGWLKNRRQIIDLPLAPATITEHQIFAHWCSHCRKKVYPKLDLRDQVLGNHRVSLKTMSFLATLKEELRLPTRAIQTFLKIFYHLHLSYGEITEVLHTVAKLGKPTYQNLGHQIRGSPVVHADETGWREDGRNGYLWNFNTPEIKYLLYRRSRGKQVVREVVGDEFEGVLVSDFYAAYNTHLGFHQRCWVHLLRDIGKLRETYPEHQELDHWAKAVTDLYQSAKEYKGPNPEKYPHPQDRKRQRWQDQASFQDKLLNICQPYLSKETPMTTLCKRVDKYSDELFLFIACPQTPSDNNSAERSLRHSVVARKISGGTRSEKGSETKFILASLFGTWKLQDKNPFQECLNLLKTTSTRAQPALETLPEV